MTAKKTKLIAGLAIAAAAAVAVPGAAQASGASDAAAGDRGCAASFDRAQNADMTGFRDKDIASVRDGHAADAASIITAGTTTIGRDAIVDQTAKMFAAFDFTWTWKEVARDVSGCKSAYIIYDTVFAVPSLKLSIHALTGVTYTRENGRWLVILDQSTLLK